MSGALYLGGVMTVNLTGCIKWVVLVTSLTTRECSEKNRVFFYFQRNGLFKFNHLQPSSYF